MSQDLRIEWCPSSRLPALQSFIDKNWAAGHVLAKDADLFRWQHPHLESAARLSMLTAVDNEQIVGLLGVIPVGISVYGERVPGGFLAMWFALPEYRNRQAGLALLNAAHSHCQVVGVLGFNSQVHITFKAMRYEIWPELPRFVSVISDTRMALMFRESGNGWHLTPLRHKRVSPKPPDHIMEWDESFVERWDSFWDEFSRGIVGTWRDWKYLRHRYARHPRYRYKLLFAENPKTHQLEGLAVYRLEPVGATGQSVMRIVEFLADLNAGERLADALIARAHQHEVAFADFFCTSEIFANPLVAAGFYRESEDSGHLPCLFQPLEPRYRPLNAAIRFPSGSPIRSGSDVYFTKSDGDQDRPNLLQ